MHDVCAPISLAVHEPSEVQRTGLEGALALWRDRGVSTVRVVEGAAAAEAAIQLRFEVAGRPFYGLYDDEASVVYVNSTIEDLRPLSIVIAHELGHAFGLEHIDAARRRSLMNPGNLVTPPTEEDRTELEALWGRCDWPGPDPR